MSGGGLTKGTKGVGGFASSLVLLKKLPELLGLSIGAVLGRESATLGDNGLGSVRALDVLEAIRSPPLLDSFNFLLELEDLLVDGHV